MERGKDLCQGLNAKGAPCGLRSKSDSDYCRFHQPEPLKIKDFFTKHKEGILAFLEEASTEPVVGDIRELFRLEPPQSVPRDVPFDDQDIQTTGTSFQGQPNLENLLALVSRLLETEAPRQDVRQILGSPHWSKVARCDRFQFSLLDNRTVHVECWYDIGSPPEQKPDDRVSGIFVSYRDPE